MIKIDPRSSMPIYEQIVANIKEAILKGIISPTDKLPSIREMASMLVTNPNTVSKAYSELERQGVIETLRGRGTFVCENFRPKLEEERMETLINTLKQVVLEARYLNLTDEKLCNIIKGMYGNLEGGEKSDKN
ncbi:GntR family transcriptional regulator [Clostridium cylindrosporum]|uniref:Transcriptional regulator, GntR family n=1 Tax=Clostridium cylindrosporum DSM 605 TaxID=1121307 RepID=A0A0J8G3X4_CLOCY|nr:GntR family transcriptional regulator [Clostridium cylindrosporum]KMT22406.1 transcriptional regulator, GntR family [Clostridium cylindrosporum DSM 605]